jgi:hypothetical protein
MSGQGAGRHAAVRAGRWAGLGAVPAALSSSPLAAAAASPLCPCPIVPEAPVVPLLAILGAASWSVAVVGRRRGARSERGGLIRRLLSRLALIAILAVMTGALALVAGSAATAGCVCAPGSPPAPTNSAAPDPHGVHAVSGVRVPVPDSGGSLAPGRQ